MTKLRQTLTVEQAVAKIIGALGDDGVAKATGKSARLVRHWSDPDDDTHRIPLHQAIALDAAYVAAGHGEAPIFQAYKSQLGLKSISPEEKSPMILAAERQVGAAKFTEMAMRAEADGHISEAEIAEMIDVGAREAMGWTRAHRSMCTRLSGMWGKRNGFKI